VIQVRIAFLADGGKASKFARAARVRASAREVGGDLERLGGGECRPGAVRLRANEVATVEVQCEVSDEDCSLGQVPT